jgi:peptidoglycan/xylan/chitin deacetylase (PgdA/CDA1 family)
MKRTILIIPILLALLASCGQASSESVQQTAIAQSIMQQLQVRQTQAALALTPTITPTPPPATATPIVTSTPQPTATPTWVHHDRAEYIYAPILLYHHIRDVDNPNRYDVSLDTFSKQLEALQSWGYTPITISTLANVIRNGGDLPEKPIMISFDDGDIDIYQNAYPIMKKYGFMGTFYIVGNRVGADQFVNADQIKELIADGWEIGCHGFSHQDMSKDHDAIETEGLHAKKVLQDKLGITINSFAYPYGGFDAEVGNHIAGYGFTSGAGLGTSYIHSPSTLFYLSRMEVRGDYNMDAFAMMLPWSPMTTPMPMPQKSN